MTRVKVEFFKYTGKWYTSFEFESNFAAHQLIEIKEEAKKKSEFITDMSFTIEVDEENKGWNKYLFVK